MYHDPLRHSPRLTICPLIIFFSSVDIASRGSPARDGELVLGWSPCHMVTNPVHELVLGWSPCHMVTNPVHFGTRGPKHETCRGGVGGGVTSILVQMPCLDGSPFSGARVGFFPLRMTTMSYMEMGSTHSSWGVKGVSPLEDEIWKHLLLLVWCGLGFIPGACWTSTAASSPLGMGG